MMNKGIKEFFCVHFCLNFYSEARGRWQAFCKRFDMLAKRSQVAYFDAVET